jgi:PRTRC genetic system ParB family protein
VEQQISEIPLDRIRVQPGFNHRRYFDPARHVSLVESIKAQGIVQPVIVRPDPESIVDYTIVAGERRWRASKDAGLSAIPAVVRNLTDREALAISLVENKDRENVTPGEEAEAARRAIDACDGDETEACRLLGWGAEKLKCRLQLLNATPAVLDALAHRQIKIGHAELLATLPASMQALVLPNVIKTKATVEALAQQLAARAQQLQDAIFNTAGCNGCPHNSSQAQLFDTHIGEGCCSNPECWRQKTEAELVVRRAALKEEVPLVFYDREKDPHSYVAVSAETVGAEQFDQGCKGCGNFGALMATAPGKEGEVTRSLCFDTGCNRKKVAALKSAQKTAPAKANAKDSTSTMTKAENAQCTVAAPASAASVPGKVLDIIDAFVRKEASTQVDSSLRVLLAMQLFALRTLAGKHGASDAGSRMSAILKLTDDEMREEQLAIAREVLATGKTSQHGNLAEGEWSFAAARVLADGGVDFNGRFPITREFLEAHTKSGLESLLSAAAFENSLSGNDAGERAKALRKLVGGKHADIVTTVIKSGHDFGGTLLPPAVRDLLRTLTTSNKRS